jgi:hypothetical protein
MVRSTTPPQESGMNKTYLAVVVALATMVMVYGIVADEAFIRVCSGVAIVISAVALKPPSSFS